MAKRVEATASSPLRKVVVVFKTHFDLGFTDLPADVMAQYTGPMFAAVQAVLQSTAAEPPHVRYNWTLPAWPLKFLLHDPSVPDETRKAARTLVEDGRLLWHAWPFTTHTAFCGMEELVRGLHISRGLSEEFGRWPLGAKQTDVPGHTWALPSLLARAGVKFLHLGCNSGSHSPHVPRLFWWEGPDGARLLTYYSPGGYGTPLLPTDDWPFDTWLALQQTHDNLGPHAPENLVEMRALVAERAPGVELVFGELGDFAESLLERPEQLAALPIVSCDLADTWIHGVGTMPREVKRVRELRAKLPALEVCAAAFDWPGSGTGEANAPDYPLARKIAPLIDAAYEQLLLFGEHTWGLDVKSTIKRVYGPQFEAARRTEPYLRLESSWEAKAAYVSKAEAFYEQAATAIREAQARGSVPVVRPSPAGAPETLHVGAGLFASPDSVLENDYLRVEVDPVSGGIVSLLDKTSGGEWVDKSSGEPFAGYRYDIYSAADIAEFMRFYGLFFQDWFVQDFGKAGYPEDTPHVTAYARNFTLRKQPAGETATIILEGGRLEASEVGATLLPPQTVSIKISHHAHSPDALQLEYSVTGKGATPLAESTVVPFPFNLPRPLFRIGQVGSMIDPARDIAEGANRYLWCVDGGVDVSDERVGVTIQPLDMPLVSIGDVGIYRFDPRRVPAEPLVYAHLSNTQWGTNFPQWLEGDFSWRVSLLTHTGDWRAGPLGRSTPGYLRYLLPAHAHIREIFNLEYHGLEFIGCRPRHDGQGLVLRYRDREGIPRRLELSAMRAWPWKGNVRVWLCDLMERPMKLLYAGDAHGIAGGLNIKPFAVETLLVEHAPREVESKADSGA